MSTDDSNQYINNPNKAEFGERMGELNWDIQPRRDLWPDISSKIRFADKRKQHTPNSEAKTNKPWLPYAVAASTLFAVVSLMFSTMSYQYAQDSKQQNAALVQYQQAQLALIDQQHRMVRVQFARLLEEQSDTLNPAFVTEVSTLMMNIDQAASQIKNALVTQPNNPSYTFMLVSTYQQELNLLNKVKSNKGVSI
ncbi:MAG: hypothetical protein ACI9XU_002320 [Arenicella sp.]|jgi:hypothetical protein